MKINDIYTAYVEWPGGGKRRPVLILSNDEKIVRVFKITSQYAKKSPSVQKYYYCIKLWNKAGLKKPSFIDTISVENLLKSKVGFYRIGSLQLVDKKGLVNFLQSRYP